MDNDIGIIILAGGSSRRMGEDKGLIEVNGKAIIEYLLDTCRHISERIIVVSDNDLYNNFGYPIFADLIKNAGPMGGLFTGLQNSNNDWNLVLSCDVPLVSVQLLREIVDCRQENTSIIIAKHQQQIHPLIGLYHKQCTDIIKNLIKEKQYRMSSLHQRAKATILDLNDFPAKEFLNLNTKNELEIFKSHVNGG